MFVYFLCFQTPPKRRVVGRRNLARSCVTTMSRTSALLLTAQATYRANQAVAAQRAATAC